MNFDIFFQPNIHFNNDNMYMCNGKVSELTAMGGYLPSLFELKEG